MITNKIDTNILKGYKGKNEFKTPLFIVNNDGSVSIVPELEESEDE